MTASSTPLEVLGERIARAAFVDGHCHPLARDWTVAAAGGSPRWRRCFTEAETPRSLERDVPAMRGYREFLRALALDLGVETASAGDPGVETASAGAPAGHFADLEAAVAGRRDERAREPEPYLRGLLDRVGVSGFLVDAGFGGPSAITPADLSYLAGRPAWPILRIETAAEACLRSGALGSATAFAEALGAAIEKGLDSGAVGLKSVAAYRAGLELPRPSAAAVGRALADIGRQSARLEDPALVSLAVWTAAEIAARRGVPLQFHTGFGDTDLHLPAADPSLLRPLLRDPKTEGAPIALLHCHPFVAQAAYLASVYPQVHVDLSLAIPLLGVAGAIRAIDEALALCPWTKLLAGSDGHSFPEMHWRGALVWREALGSVLMTEVAAGRLDPDEAGAMAEAILGGNVRRLYRLDA